MNNNPKVGITAEMVSIIKAKNDSRYLFFVSSKARMIYNVIRKIIPSNKLEEIFTHRLQLSEIFDERIKNVNPQQIVELGCGYSLRGFNMCLKNKDIVYIDSDMGTVISDKKVTLEDICRRENLIFPKNYKLISIDVLKDDLTAKIKPLILGGKTLIIAEGLASYFDKKEFEDYLHSVNSLIKNLPDLEFFSHEKLKEKKNFIFRILRIFISLLTATGDTARFKNKEEFEKYLHNMGFSEFEVKMQNGYMCYQINR